MQIHNWVPGAYLNPPPRSWDEFVLDDLQRAIRLIQKVHPASINPQFRIATHEGSYTIEIALGVSEQDKQQRMRLLRDFMAWKGAPYFVVVIQRIQPPSVTAMAISADTALVLQSQLTLRPLNFSEPRILSHNYIDKALIDLLPRTIRIFPSHRIRQLKRWFGPDGKHPAAFTKRCKIGYHHT